MGEHGRNVKNIAMEELNLSEDDLFDLLDQKSTNKDSIPSKRQVPIEELEYWLKILCENLKEKEKICSKKNMTEIKEILDPDCIGKFEFRTLLTLVAEKTENLEAEIKKTKQNKISEDETQKYALRPRKDLKKPTRIRSNYYEY